MKDKIIPAIAVLALLGVCFLWATAPKIPQTGTQNFGATAAGNLLAENYIPYVLYNGGYSSAKDLYITGGITFSSSGTTFTRQNDGQCYLAPGVATIAASTTISIDCQATQAPGGSATYTTSALTGVILGDNVLVQLSTTTAQTATQSGSGSGLSISGASASTTSGYITLRLYNGTGATFTWPVGSAASGTASYFVTK